MTALKIVKMPIETVPLVNSLGLFGSIYEIPNVITTELNVAYVTSIKAPLVWAFTDVNTTNNTVTIASHGLTGGIQMRVAATGGGTLPTALLAGTLYVVIVVDTNTIAFAASVLTYGLGYRIQLTDQGTGPANTLIDSGITSSSVTIQKSNDGTNWLADGSSLSFAASTITSRTSRTDPTYRYTRLSYAVTNSGTFSAVSTLILKGFP